MCAVKSVALSAPVSGADVVDLLASRLVFVVMFHVKRKVAVWSD